MGILIFIFTFLLGPAVSWASDLSGSLDDIAKGMATYFPKGTGTVAGVGYDTVEIAMEAGESLAEGVWLSAYRQGEPFYHPVTGVILGRFEEEVTLLEVIQVQGQRIVARPMDRTKVISIGDEVRLTQTRIPVGILPTAQRGSEGLTQEFVRALEDTGRFLPLPRGSEEKTAPGPMYWVTFESMGDSPEVGGAHPVHVRLQNAKTQTVLFDVNVQIKPVEESDFIVESFQQRQFIKYPRGGGEE